MEHHRKHFIEIIRFVKRSSSGFCKEEWYKIRRVGEFAIETQSKEVRGEIPHASPNAQTCKVVNIRLFLFIIENTH
jgi:hypothetical protein